MISPRMVRGLSGKELRILLIQFPCFGSVLFAPLRRFISVGWQKSSQSRPRSLFFAGLGRNNSRRTRAEPGTLGGAWGRRNKGKGAWGRSVGERRAFSRRFFPLSPGFPLILSIPPINLLLLFLHADRHAAEEVGRPPRHDGCDRHRRPAEAEETEAATVQAPRHVQHRLEG